MISTEDECQTPILPRTKHPKNSTFLPTPCSAKQIATVINNSGLQPPRKRLALDITDSSEEESEDEEAEFHTADQLWAACDHEVLYL